MKTLRLTKDAFKALGKHKMRSLLMMLGIIIGIGTLTVIVSVGEGSKSAVIQRMRAMGADASLMVQPGSPTTRGGMPEGGTGIATLRMEDAQAIAEQVSNVKNVAPVMVKGGATAKYGDKSSTPMVFGVTPIWSEVRNFHTESGEFISDEDVGSYARVCLVGQRVVEELFEGANPIGQNIFVNDVILQVKGVLEKKGTSAGGGTNLDNRILVPITTFSKHLFNQEYLSQIVIQLKDISGSYQTADEITGLLRERHHINPGEPEDFRIRIPQEMIKTLTESSATMTLYLGIIAGISLLVGGIIIMNIMLVSVSERKREIGIRKAIGAKKKDIILQFLVESVVVTLTGGILGVAVGLLGAEIFSLITQTPAAISWKIFAAGFVFSALVGIFFGVQPARKAAALNPVEALQ